MKTKACLFKAAVLFLTTSTQSPVRYVDINNANPAPPYVTWSTAATNIQDAIDVALAGDDIVVTNGVYQTGGRTVDGTTTNRVAAMKSLTVRSVNGPEVTVIDGTSAVRCAYLTNGAALVGFTLTNGIAYDGGGVSCESGSVMVSNCVLSGNSAHIGGGAYGGTLNNCTLTDNFAFRIGVGGTRQTVGGYGGGAVYSTLNNCILTSNYADRGSLGGGGGGGVSGGTLNNCTLSGNSAAYGGGANNATLNNCTLTGNDGGAFGGALNNCIAYYNFGANYNDSSTLNYCCTTPMPANGVGNITAEPQLTDLAHLSSSSPCRAAGSTAYISGMDIDGEAWVNPPSMGCDEFYAGVTSGPLSLAIAADYTNVAAGFTVNLTATLAGRASANRWEFGDGTIISNRPVSVSHSWSTGGDYAVAFRAFNDSNPSGVRATVTVHVTTQTVYYVAADSGSPVSPYSSWATAATNIQDAVDVAPIGAAVLVTNGIYQTGGRAVSGMMTNRVAVTKLLTVRSVNGPEVTLIRGYQVPGTTNGDGAVRCVYLGNGASLVGFTLTNGATQFYESGGGVRCESANTVVSNCVLNGNSSFYGGGASYGTLNNCTFTGNTADDGGGARDASLNNCTLTGNSAGSGGGTSAGTLNNCTLTGNFASYHGGGAYGWGVLNNCTLSGNSAGYHGGGAAYNSTLNNCTLSGNTATAPYSQGGGASDATLNNCTLIGNSAHYGGGAYGGTLNNCIVYFNSAPNGANYFEASYAAISFNYTCTTPLPTAGVGNFANAPLFVNQAGGNLRLQSNSPCINAGRNA